MSGIIDKLSGIAEKIAGLPALIANALLDGIKSIFIPDTDYINTEFDKLKQEIQLAFGISAYDMDLIFNKEIAFSDVTVTMYGMECTVVKTDKLKQVILAVRPYIRGFIVLLMVFYNINQFLMLIGQAPVAIGAGKELVQGGNGGDGE